MLANHVILAVLWILYCVLHSVLASVRVKRWVQNKLQSKYRYYRLFYTFFAAVTLVAIVIYQLSLTSGRIYNPTIGTTVLGSVVLFVGLVTMAICIRKYFLSLSGLKSLYQESPASELMITGIHRYVRHPLYTGTFFAIWGLWVLFPSWSLLLTNIVITGYTLFAIQLEEEKLVAEFGDQYRQYQHNVPKLIPRFSLAD